MLEGVDRRQEGDEGLTDAVKRDQVSKRMPARAAGEASKEQAARVDAGTMGGPGVLMLLDPTDTRVTPLADPMVMVIGMAEVAEGPGAAVPALRPSRDAKWCWHGYAWPHDRDRASSREA